MTLERIAAALGVELCALLDIGGSELGLGYQNAREREI